MRSFVLRMKTRCAPAGQTIVWENRELSTRIVTVVKRKFTSSENLISISSPHQHFNSTWERRQPRKTRERRQHRWASFSLCVCKNNADNASFQSSSISLCFSWHWFWWLLVGGASQTFTPRSWTRQLGGVGFSPAKLEIYELWEKIQRRYSRLHN